MFKYQEIYSLLLAIKLYSKININYKLNIYMFGDPFQIAPV